MITVAGGFFPKNVPYGEQEHRIFNCIKNQIDKKFTKKKNLIINLTWFGPQFSNGAWDQVQLLAKKEKFDNLFWTGIIDPLTLLPDQIKQIEQIIQANNIYYIGVAFNGSHTFHTHSIVCREEFPNYDDNDLELQDLKFLFVNYNRKPKPHRILFVDKLVQNHLDHLGVVSLGKPESHYNVAQGLAVDKYYKVLENHDYTRNGKFPLDNAFGGVPPDFCSLGDLDIWKKHFLNIVSETEFYPWDNLFMTEKTLKPIIGLRPFVINGQVKIYQYLRDNGFKTFNHFFDFVKLEDIPEFEVHDSIIQVIKKLSTMDTSSILSMYHDMLPDLRYNRARFFEFAQEQKYKIEHLFE